MTKQQRVAAIVALVVIAALGMMAFKKKGLGPEPTRGPLVKDDLTITRVLQRGKEQDGGYIYLPYLRADAARYVNVAVDLNGDGSYAGYDVDGKRQEEWLVKDWAAFAGAAGSMGFPIAIPDRSIKDRLPLAATVVTGEKLEGEAWPAAMPVTASAEAVHVRSYAISDRDIFYVTEKGDKKDTGRSGLGEGMVLAVAMPGATGPASQQAGEPLTYSHQNHDIPDQDQRKSECSPTGISNNFRWLAKKYGFEDRMPGNAESLINELKGDLQWDDGVTPGENTIAGKRSFIERHKLPLEAHLIGEEFDHNILYKIFQELEKGQAVEVGIAFITPEGEWDGAHLVGVAGVANFGAGERWISIVDPSEAARTDGGNSESYRMSGNELVNYSSDVASRIRFAYAQSPVKDERGDFVYPADSKDFVLDPGDALAEPGSDVTVSRGDFGFFNVAVDHPGDHMVGESFEIAASVTWTGRRTTLRYFDAEGARQGYEFGASRPWTLLGHFNGGGVLAPMNVLQKPDSKSVSERRERAEARFTCVKPGLAKVAYVADIGWTRDGGVVPAGLSEKYRRQLRNSQIMVVDSPLFRCMTVPAPTSTNTGVAPTPFCPGVVEDPNGQEIAVLKIGNKCYPKEQFHSAKPDRCDAQHWHGNAPQVVALDGSKMAEPDPACGFGKVGELPEGMVRLSLDEAGKILGGVLQR